MLPFYADLFVIFVQISSNGGELKLNTSDQKIVRVTLSEPVGLIFSYHGSIF